MTTARRAQPIEAALAAGRDIVTDIDWQGTQQLAESVARRSRHRLRAAAEPGRARSAAAHARPGQRRRRRQRMAKSAEEMSHWSEYDYVIVNRDIDDSVAASAGDRHRRAAAAHPPARPRRFRQPPARAMTALAANAHPPIGRRHRPTADPQPLADAVAAIPKSFVASCRCRHLSVRNRHRWNVPPGELHMTRPPNIGRAASREGGRRARS